MDETGRRRAVQKLFNAFDIHLLGVRTRVLVAVSGGTDSLALFEALARWPRRNELEIHILAVSHGTRAGSIIEAESVVARAKVMGFSAQVIYLKEQPSANEAELRLARYCSLAKVAQNLNISMLCTAHHADDQAEGFFLDLLGEGGGKNGAGMAFKTEILAITIVRPFLELSKLELSHALYALKNTNNFYDAADLGGKNRRARTRNLAIPMLSKHYPQISARCYTKAKWHADRISEENA